MKSKSEAPKKETMKKVQKEKKSKNPNNVMRTVRIERVVISAGATGDALTKSKKLLEIISGRKAQIVASQKRIPAFDVRPGLEVGVSITVRGEDGIKLLRRLLGAIDNKIKKSSVADNHLSFGIKEYIEIPEMEYHRDIGIRGLNVTVVFARPGLRVQRKKIKKGHVPKRQHVTKEEVISKMEEQFKTEFI